jgi:hypothetical protein
MATDASKIQVINAIIHRVEKEVQDHDLSQTQLPLDENAQHREYLGKLVVKALDDERAKKVKFSPKGESIVKDLGDAILSDSKVFIDASVGIAKYLGAVMRKSPGNIRGGNLIVCTYTDSGIASKLKTPPTCLALIKIYPSQAYRVVTRKRDGLRYLSFDPVTDLMPTDEMNLQKAAMILPAAWRKEYHLHLLDRQTEKVAADYFAKGFLNVEGLGNERQITSKFYRAVNAVYESLFLKATADQPVRLTAEQADELQQHLNAALRTGQLVPKHWIGNLGFLKAMPEEQRQQVMRTFNLELENRHLEVDKEIDIDEGYASTLTQWGRLSGEGVFIEWVREKQRDVFPDGIPEPNADGVIKLTVLIKDPVPARRQQ